MTSRQEDTLKGRSQNLGNEYTLRGGVAKDSSKLIKVDDENENLFPWIVTASATPNMNGVAVSAWPGAILSGTFGSGGISHKVEFDVSPDTEIALPGTSVDLTLKWASLTIWPNGALAPVVDSGAVDGTSIVCRACAKHGVPSSPNATRTLLTLNADAISHDFSMTIPAFSNEYMLYLNADADYAIGLTVEFLSANTATAPIVVVPAAALLAMKNAGARFPIPGQATFMNVKGLPTATIGSNTFFLNL